MFNLIKAIAILSASTAIATLGANLVIEQLETKPAEASQKNSSIVKPGNQSCTELDERGISRYWTDPNTGRKVQICSDSVVSTTVKCRELDERGISRDWTDSSTGKRSRFCQN